MAWKHQDCHRYFHIKSSSTLKEESGEVKLYKRDERVRESGVEVE